MGMTLESSTVWLVAPEHVRNINHAWFTVLAFVKIFAKHRQCDVSVNTPFPLRDFAATLNSFERRCILGVTAMVARDT